MYNQDVNRKNFLSKQGEDGRFNLEGFNYSITSNRVISGNNYTSTSRFSLTARYQLAISLKHQPSVLQKLIIIDIKAFKVLEEAIIKQKKLKKKNQVIKLIMQQMNYFLGKKDGRLAEDFNFIDQEKKSKYYF